MGILAKTDMKLIYFESLRLLIFLHSHTQHITNHNMSKKQLTMLKTKFLVFHLPKLLLPMPSFQQMATPTLKLFRVKVINVILGFSIFLTFLY